MLLMPKDNARITATANTPRSHSFYREVKAGLNCGQWQNLYRALPCPLLCG